MAERLEIRLTGTTALDTRLRAMGRGLSAAYVPSLNRATGAGLTQMKRATSKATGLPQKHISPHLKFVKATPSVLRARLQVDDKPVPAILYLGLRGFKSGKGIGGQSYLGGTLPPGAFFADMAQRGWKRPRRIFERTTPKRFPLREVQGPSIADMIMRFGLLSGVRERIQTVFAERLTHELDRLTRVANG